jgi:hypothetical protein
MYKKIVLFALFISFSICVFSQIKVTSSNYVGIRTTNPTYPIELNGDTKFVSTAALFTSGANTFRILLTNPGIELGSSTDKIDFWYSTNNFNTLYATDFLKMSDISIKKNITNIDNGLEIISKLRPVSYNLIEDGTFDYGFIAQEVEEVLPGVVSESHKLKAISYLSIIPFSIAAINEQQTEIDSLKAENVELQNDIEVLRKEIEKIRELLPVDGNN